MMNHKMIRLISGLLALGLAVSAALPLRAAAAVNSEGEDYFYYGTGIVPIAIDSYHYEHKSSLYGGYVQASWPEIIPTEKSRRRLASSLEEYTDGIQEGINAFIEESEQQLADDYDSGYTMPGGYELNVSSTVVRADTDIVSILTATQSYARGAHGFTALSSLHLDPRTGAVLELGDIFTSTRRLPQILEKEFLSQDPDPENLFTSVEDATRELMAEDALCFVVGMEGVTFYYDPYILRPFAAGTQSVTLFYEDYPDLIKSKYRFSGSYIAAIPENVPQRYADHGDPVSFVWDYENYAGTTDISIGVMKDSSLYSWEYLEDIYNTDPDAMFYLVRDGDAHQIYVRSGVLYWGQDDDDIRDIFQAYYIGPEYALVKEDEINLAIAKIILGIEE